MTNTVKDLLTVATAAASNHQANMEAARATARTIAAANPALGQAPAPTAGEVASPAVNVP